MSTYPRGIVTAIMTSLTKDLKPNVEGIRQLIERQLSAGVSGFFVLGTWGEGMMLNVETRMRYLEKFVEYVPSKSMVIAHVGCANAEDTRVLAKHACDLGLVASAVGPVYHKPDKLGLIKYYEYVSSGCDRFMIYNNIARQGYNITPDWFEALAKELSNLVGIKDTSYNVAQVHEYVTRFGSRYYVASGGDQYMAFMFLAGAPAHICGVSNVFPELATSIWKAVESGDIAKALEYQRRVNELIKILRSFDVEVQVAAREILRMKGVDIGWAPPPSRELTPEEKAKLEQLLRSKGFL